MTTENDELPSKVNEKLKADNKEQLIQFKQNLKKQIKKQLREETEVKAFSEPKAIKLEQAFTLLQ